MTKRDSSPSLFDGAILKPALVASFTKLDPRALAKNPVMFTVELVALVATVIMARDIAVGAAHIGFEIQIVLWLWVTVLFATFAEAVAEGRGKAQADSLRRMRSETMAKLLLGVGDMFEPVRAERLKVGDKVLVETGDLVPGDGEIYEGVATIDESAITGESAPVIRESGGDRSAVTGGTRVLSDRIKVRITAEQGSSFLDRMISLVEGASRAKTPNELALSVLLAAFTIIFVLAVATIPSFAAYAGGAVSVVVLIALFVTLIPTTIGALLSAIGIAGMNRLVRFNVLATSGRAVEAAGDVDTLLLDKTGTITWATAMPPSSCPSAAPARTRSRVWPSSPAWPTRRRKAARSSCWPRTVQCPRGRGLRAQRDLRALHGPDPHERRRYRRRGDPQGRRRRHPRSCPCAGRHRAGRRGQPHRLAHRQGGRHAARGVARRPCAGRRLPEGRREGRASASASPSCAPWASAR